MAPFVLFCYKSPLSACSAFSVWKRPDKALMQLLWLVWNYSIESDPSNKALLPSCLRFPPSNGMCSCYRAVCAFGMLKPGHMLINRFLCDQRERGKWSAAWGLSGVHVAFVNVWGSSAEPGEVQRARGNGNEREHIHQDEVASGSCSSVYPRVEGLIRYFHWWVGVIEKIETTHIKLVNDKLSGPPAVLEERIRS